jgi:hypothetical protein
MAQRIVPQILAGVSAGCAVGGLLAGLFQLAFRHMADEDPLSHAEIVAYTRMEFLLTGAVLGGITAFTYALVAPTRPVSKVIICIVGYAAVGAFVSRLLLQFNPAPVAPIAAVIGACAGSWRCLRVVFREESIIPAASEVKDNSGPGESEDVSRF